MIDLIYNNQHWFAGILFIVSACFNAVCDAIKFSSKKNDKLLDFWWHVYKYVFDRPALFLAGVLSYNALFDLTVLLYSDFFHYIWHLPSDFQILISFIACSFVIKEIVYKLTRKYLDRNIA